MRIFAGLILITAILGGCNDPSRPPSFLILYLDDQSVYQTADLYLPLTLQRMADLGMTTASMSESFVTTPRCCPSRASLLTGQYVHTHGILYNAPSSPGALDGGAQGFTGAGLDQSTISTWLADAGYRTGFFGKYLNGYQRVQPAGYVPPGWTDFRAIFRKPQMGVPYQFRLAENGTVNTYNGIQQNYLTDVLRERALGFLDETPGERPFFLLFSSDVPHLPAIPAPRHAGLFPGLLAPRPPNHNEEDVSDKPQWIQNLVWTEAKQDAADQHYADGARCLAAVDEAMADLLDRLEYLGRLDDTVVLITNDNGLLFGEHRYASKRCAYEEAVRVPFIVGTRRTDLLPKSVTSDHPVANIDIAPTLASLAGAAIPAGHVVDGVNLVPFFKAGERVRKEVLIECFTEPDDTAGIPTWSGWINADWKYVEYDTGEKELYSRFRDPFELWNSTPPGP